MTIEEEIQFLRLQKKNAELTAQAVMDRKRIADLERMHRADQSHIGTLNALLKRSTITRAEAVFKDG